MFGSSVLGKWGSIHDEMTATGIWIVGILSPLGLKLSSVSMLSGICRGEFGLGTRLRIAARVLADISAQKVMLKPHNQGVRLM